MSRSSFVQCLFPAACTEVLRGCFYVVEFVSECRKWIFSDRDEFDSILEFNHMKAVTEPFSEWFRKGQSPSVVKRHFGHTSLYHG